MNIIFSQHALDEMERRNITKEQVISVIENRVQVIELEGKNIYQERITFPNNKIYLLRVFVNIVVEPNVVITVYRTSKINKYWIF